MKEAQLQLAFAPAAARVHEAMVLAGQSVLSGRGSDQWWEAA